MQDTNTTSMTMLDSRNNIKRMHVSRWHMHCMPDIMRPVLQRTGAVKNTVDARYLDPTSKIPPRYNGRTVIKYFHIW